MRKLAIAIGLIVVAIVVALLVIPFFVNANVYRPKIEAELSSRLGRDVTLGNLHLRLIPFNFKADSVTIAEDPSFGSSQPFAQSGEVSVSPKLGPLLHKDVEITSIELRRPVIHLIRDAKSTWNFSTLGKKTSPSPKQSSAPHEFELGELAITDGKLTVDDLKDRKPPEVYDHIDVALKNFAADKQFPFTVTAHLPGGGTETVSLNGTAGPIATEASQTPVEATVNFKGVSLAGLRKFVSSQALAEMDAIVSGNIQVQNRANSLNSNGSITATDVKIKGAPLGQPVTADYKITSSSGNDVLHVNDATVKIGSTPIHMNGTVDTRRTPAMLNLNVKANDASLADVAHLASAAGAPLPGGATLKGNVNLDVTAMGPATAPELNGKITAQNAEINGISHPVSVKDLTIALAPHPGEPAARLETNNALAKLLNGSLSLNLDQGQIKGVDLMGEAAQAGKFLLGSNLAGKGLTELLKVTGNFNLVNGVATTNDLKAVLAQGPSAGGMGTIDLIRQTLNMRVNAILPPSVTQKLGSAAGGNGIAGLAETVLANKNGELVVPLIVTGTFEKPNFAPDLQMMAQMRLKHLAPTLDNPAALSQAIAGIAGGGKNNPGGALGAVMGALGGQMPQSSQPPQQQKNTQQQQQPNLGDALGALLGGKKKPPEK